jgi:cell division protein FtsB
MRLPKWLSSTVIIIILLVIAGTIGGLQFKQWRKRQLIQREIDSLVQQQGELEQKNRELEESLDLLGTQNYKEKLAREQLNLKKEGEIVINFPEPKENLPANNQVAAETNPQKWWRYFFHN